MMPFTIIDMQKVYDYVEWDFVIALLDQMGIIIGGYVRSGHASHRSLIGLCLTKKGSLTLSNKSHKANGLNITILVHYGGGRSIPEYHSGYTNEGFRRNMSQTIMTETPPHFLRRRLYTLLTSPIEEHCVTQQNPARVSPTRTFDWRRIGQYGA